MSSSIGSLVSHKSAGVQAGSNKKRVEEPTSSSKRKRGIDFGPSELRFNSKQNVLNYRLQVDSGVIVEKGEPVSKVRRPIINPENAKRKTAVTGFILEKLRGMSTDPKVVQEVMRYITKCFDTPIFNIFEELLSEKPLNIGEQQLSCNFLGHGNFHFVFELLDTETGVDVGRVLKLPFKHTGDTVEFNATLRRNGIHVLETKQEGALIIQERCDVVIPEGNERNKFGPLCAYLKSNDEQYELLKKFLVDQIESYKEIVDQTTLKNGEFPIFDIRPANCGIHKHEWVLLDAGGETSEDEWFIHTNTCLNEWIRLFTLMGEEEAFISTVDSLKYKF